MRIVVATALLLVLASPVAPGDPWLPLGLGLVLLGLAGALASTGRSRRGLWVAATTTALCLWLLEGAASARRRMAGEPRSAGDYATGAYWNDDDPVLGYAPRPGVRVRSASWLGPRQLYDVTYSIDETGLRRTPPAARPGDEEGCALFFGCSITFGEGLEDRESLPWLVSERMGGRWRVYNFGFHGYGPHQMLAAIDSGRVRQIVGPCRGRTIAILQYGVEHVRRAMGPSAWDRHGPRYRLDATGGLALDGRFEPAARSSPEPDRFRPELVRWFESRFVRAISAEERRFFVALLSGARARLRSDLPDAELHLLLLDPRPARALVRELEAADVRVHPVRELLPGWAPRAETYSIPLDGHPNALYNRRLAEWIAAQLLRPPADAARP